MRAEEIFARMQKVVEFVQSRMYVIEAGPIRVTRNMNIEDNMIISKRTATKLANSSKATIEDCTTEMDGKTYRIVTRHDIQRVDHFREV